MGEVRSENWRIKRKKKEEGKGGGRRRRSRCEEKRRDADQLNEMRSAGWIGLDGIIVWAWLHANNEGVSGCT